MAYACARVRVTVRRLGRVPSPVARWASLPEARGVPSHHSHAPSLPDDFANVLQPLTRCVQKCTPGRLRQARGRPLLLRPRRRQANLWPHLTPTATAICPSADTGAVGFGWSLPRGGETQSLSAEAWVVPAVPLVSLCAPAALPPPPPLPRSPGRPRPWDGLRGCVSAPHTRHHGGCGPHASSSAVASTRGLLGRAQLYLTLHPAPRDVACQVQPHRGLEAHTVFSIFCMAMRPVRVATRVRPRGRGRGGARGSAVGVKLGAGVGAGVLWGCPPASRVPGLLLPQTHHARPQGSDPGLLQVPSALLFFFFLIKSYLFLRFYLFI